MRAVRTEPEPPRRGFLTALMALPFMSGTALAAPASDIQATCRRAIEHAAYVNTASIEEDWDDDRLGDEGERYNVLLRRAIDAPSRSLDDVRAKARLALDDFERGTFIYNDPAENHAAEAALQDDERLIRVVLREIATIGA